MSSAAARDTLTPPKDPDPDCDHKNGQIMFQLSSTNAMPNTFTSV
jgi:hypothetical protein